MRKRTKQILALGVAAAMAFSMAACGSKTADTSDSGAKTDTEKKDDSSSTEEGKVLNIRVWNDEFMTRVVEQYPGYEKTSDTEGKIGDVTVKWSVEPNDDNNYQNKLDAALKAQDSAAADDKVDIFLVEADYALKYVNADANVAMKLSDLGISSSDLSSQYKYTQQVVSDENGDLRGSTWQICPAGLIYNRAIAKEVIGSDDPADVQAAVKDWDSYYALGKKMKEAGYLVQATPYDTYRVYSNNVSNPWVTDGKVTVDPSIKDWAEKAKAEVDDGECSQDTLWGTNEWNAGFYPATDTANIGKGVFCYFGPAWFFNFSMKGDDEKSIAAQGGWGFTAGPQGHFWGGTWICAAVGSDNPTLDADLIKTMTADKDVMTKIATTYSEAVNNSDVIKELAGSDSGNMKILGGQNPYAEFDAAASKINLSSLGIYDQGCNEEFQNAMKEYFAGNKSYDEALDIFGTAIHEKYPSVELAK